MFPNLSPAKPRAHNVQRRGSQVSLGPVATGNYSPLTSLGRNFPLRLIPLRANTGRSETVNYARAIQACQAPIFSNEVCAWIGRLLEGD